MLKLTRTILNRTVAARSVANVLIPLLLAALLLQACRTLPPPTTGHIEISFQINDPVDDDDESLIEPQTVVWIENDKGQYVKSLLVSDWIGLEGWHYKIRKGLWRNVKLACPEWQKSSRWPKRHSEDDIDAVTKATPATGTHVVKADCNSLGAAPENYRYHVQSTYSEKGHSMIYSGEIPIGGSNVANQATVTYYPGKHDGAGEILSNVKAKYVR